MKNHTLEPGRVDYWAVRDNILTAVRLNDDEKLKELAKDHPGIFQNVVNSAKNILKRREGHES